MITDFSSLLELFAGFGLTIYFLIESKTIKTLLMDTYGEKEINRLKKSIEKKRKKEEDSLSDDEKVILLHASVDDEMIREFVKEDIIVFRHDFFTVGQFSIYLIILSCLHTHFTDAAIISSVFNFSFFTLIFCVNRTIYNDRYVNKKWNELIRGEALMLLLAFGGSLFLGYQFEAGFNLLYTKLFLILVIFYPIIWCSVRSFDGYRIERFLAKEGKKEEALITSTPSA